MADYKGQSCIKEKGQKPFLALPSIAEGDFYFLDFLLTIAGPALAGRIATLIRLSLFYPLKSEVPASYAPFRMICEGGCLGDHVQTVALKL